MDMKPHLTANPLETGVDELERYALEECVKRQRLDHRVSVLVIADKRCELAPKFAQLGADVLIADLPEYTMEIEGRILASGLRDQIAFLPTTLQTLPEVLAGQPFDIIYIRRGITGLRHAEAREVIRSLKQRLRIGGKLYLSLLGLHSELGQGYAGAEQPLDQRFAPLSPTLSEKYGIRQPVCLYSERNLFMLLLEAGVSVLLTLTTTYGNIKGIGVRV